MRKLGVWLPLLLLLLTGCSSHSAVPKIDDYNWIMTSVQTESTGQVIAYGEGGNSTLDTAKQIELICMAENGKLTLISETNGRTYTGTYQLSQTDPRSSIYEVEIDKKKGIAVSAMTTYHGGSREPTLIIALGDYVVNFFAE